MAYDAQRQVGASTANVGARPPSSHKSSSVASIEHHPVDDSIENNEQYLVDDITARTPCELLTPFRKIVKVVAHGIAEVPGGTNYCMDIPRGYARVQVGRVEPKWEDMDLEVHGSDSETLLGHTIHTWICQALHKASASSCLITPGSRQRSPSLAAISLLAAIRRLKCLQKKSTSTICKEHFA